MASLSAARTLLERGEGVIKKRSPANRGEAIGRAVCKHVEDDPEDAKGVLLVGDVALVVDKWEERISKGAPGRALPRCVDRREREGCSWERYMKGFLKVLAKSREESRGVQAVSKRKESRNCCNPCLERGRMEDGDGERSRDKP
ncbi:hypothetical protein L7F22_035720 [Adiantum nelumboides]|nr:hypothetical protein [Adiantum nelumboides]